MSDISKSIDRLKYLHAIPQNDRGARDFAPSCRKELPAIFARLAELEAELAELRERVARLRMQGGHQSWCALFGETVGWDDALVHKIEPFMLAFVARLKEGLDRPFSDRERETFKTMVRHKLGAEKERDDWRKTAEGCGAFVALWAVKFAEERGIDGLDPDHYDLMQKLGCRMDSFKRAALKETDHV